VWGYRATRVYPSASVLKAMLMVADLNRGHPDKALLKPMITRSDNAAASRVLGIVGTSGLRKVARRAGMTRFTPVTPVWGNSKVTASDQSRFFLKIDSLIPAKNRAYGMKLLASIVPSQRWGVGQVAPAGWKLYFKGGWGSGTGRVDHQVALLTKGNRRVSIAIMTFGDGTHAYGKETLRGLAKRLLRGLD
jgi:beta-lactamase class A